MDLATFEKRINAAFREHIGVNLSENQVMHFYAFMNLLIEKNKVMNLTAITEPEKIITRHFVDSCMLLKFFPVHTGGITDNSPEGAVGHAGASSFRRVVDIGTGAGFPGIPLAIIADSVDFVLTDSLGKRVDFLRVVIDALGLRNAVAIHTRAEDFCHDATYRESFDFALSRGVARLSVLSEYSLPAVKVGGKMISYKLDDIESELDESQNAIKALGGLFHMKHSYDLIPDEPRRCLVEIEKISETPNQYPRKAGLPSKRPL